MATLISTNLDGKSLFAKIRLQRYYFYWSQIKVVYNLLAYFAESDDKVLYRKTFLPAYATQKDCDFRGLKHKQCFIQFVR